VRRSAILLHPGVLFTLLWTAVLGAWLLTPESTFLRYTSSEKYVSASAIAFFLIALGAFVVGTLVGPAMFRSDRPARLTLPDVTDAGLKVLVRGTGWIFALGAVASLYLIVAGTERAGGFSALLNDIVNGETWSRLAENYFKPAKIALVTVWLHLIVAAAPLSAMGAAAAQDRATKRRQLWILAGGFVIALMISFAFAERLVAFGYVVSAAVAWAAARRALNKSGLQGLRGRSLLRFILVALIIVGFWLSSEISRTYLATRTSTGPVGVSDVRAGTPLAAERFLAYVITSTNNGMYSIDHFRERSYVGSSLSVVFTSLGWEGDNAPIVGPGSRETDLMLNELYPLNNPLTTFSLPGYAFMDLGWPGALLLFWFGAAIGAVYARFRHGELWALLVYPLCVVGILDSYRVMYWSRTEMVVPVLAIILLMASVYRAAADSRRTEVRQMKPTVS
jgi:hypothetical protein